MKNHLWLIGGAMIDVGAVLIAIAIGGAVLWKYGADLARLICWVVEGCVL